MGAGTKRSAGMVAATIIDGMKPEKIGRVLGIGVRVAGRVAGQRISAATTAAPRGPQDRANAQVEGANTGNAQAAAQAGRAVAQTGRGVAQGIGGLLRPFRRVGGILWLEIVGAFFLLPALAFGPTVWRTRASWAAGPDHRTFLASTVVVAVFLYLGVSSFWRARRRSRS
jgi:hypothetical protein